MCEQMQVVEALHQARSERMLEVNVVQSYGELTRMDTDEQAEPPPLSESEPHPKGQYLLNLFYLFY